MFYKEVEGSVKGPLNCILVESSNGAKKTSLVLGLVKERNKWFFVIRKRHPNWTVDVGLDKLSLNDAVAPIKDRHGNTLGEETLRIAFERFVSISPFSGYVRKNINAWASGQFFKQLREAYPLLV